MKTLTHEEFTSGKYTVLVKRAHLPADGEYDYSLSVIHEGKPVVVAEIFGRIDKELTVEAEKIANYIASLINNSGASTNANG